jgi:hypothetical protein
MADDERRNASEPPADKLGGRASSDKAVHIHPATDRPTGKRPPLDAEAGRGPVVPGSFADCSEQAVERPTGARGFPGAGGRD